MMFGQHTHEANATYGDIVWKLKEWMQHAPHVAQKNMNNSAKRQKALYDAKIHANQYEVGDLVWLETDISQLDTTPKLWDPFKGPYMINKRLGALDYELCMDRRMRKVVHHNQLKPYSGLIVVL